MDREELANKVYEILRKDLYEKTPLEIWIRIAETDDDSLLEFYNERIMNERSGDSL